MNAQEIREASDEALLNERKAAWNLFTASGGRGVSEADYIDLLDAEIQRRGLSTG